ncbi:hypothetical protein [Lentzea terrae]|uniref:hypothetical protein n=1 Tax=Lentzea terrae TaxID=2200761 RepID=UPI000DD45603|nr:hypothetical protein [Lentzea terrae]
MHDDERAALARLCDQLPGLRAEIAKHPAATRELLARIESRARAGEPVRALLDDLFPPDQAGVTRTFEALPSLGPGRSSEERFGCPARLCDREATTKPAGPLPRCWLTGRFMRRLAG